MAFRIKNITSFIINIHGLTLQPKEKTDLSETLSTAEIRESLLVGELYHKIQGRMVAVSSPFPDLNDIGLSIIEQSRLIHAGFFIGYLTNDELKHPFSFNADGYLLTSGSGGGGESINATVQNIDPGPYAEGEEHNLRLDDQGRLIVTDPNASTQIEGFTSVDEVPLYNPLDLGAIVQDTDPGPYDDGYIQRLRLDNQGRLIVTDSNASTQIEGFTPVGDVPLYNPLELGAIVQDADPGPYDDGYIQRLRLDDQGRLIIAPNEDIAYDAVSDANKIVPVIQAFDNHEPFSHSQLVATDSIVFHYIDARTFPFWSLICNTPDGYVDITIQASNETTEPDLTLRDYTDVTTDIYGGTCAVDSSTPAVIIVDSPLFFDSYRITYTPTGLTTWVSEGKKGSY